jgi:hypothetical protein
VRVSAARSADPCGSCKPAATGRVFKKAAKQNAAAAAQLRKMLG